MQKISLFQKLKAFTLAEMLVVVTILSILATVGFISYTRYNASVRDAVRSTDIKSITRVLGLHYLDRSKYPTVTEGVGVYFSGALVWTQGVFGDESMRETGKILGDLADPKYGNQYTYSTTANNREYQLGAVFESEERAGKLVAFNTDILDITPIGSAYAADPFTPDELNPIIWLDATDIDADGDTGDNPSNSSSISSWENKSSAGSANNPAFINGNLQYTTSGYDGSYPGVFIANNRGMRLNNSAITEGDIFYVVQKNDPFGSTDSNGYGMFSTSNQNYLIGYKNKYRFSLRIGNSPNHSTSSPATTSSRTAPFIYGFHISNAGSNYNYGFYDTGYQISQGTSNSISGHTWAFNRAGAVTNKNSDLVISEILIFDSPLTSGEREKVEGYLAHKWGQEYYLPSSHPYKSNPPESSGPPPVPDSTPDVFSFNDVTDADLSTLYTSNAVSITGINTTTSISISGSGAEYNINGGSFTSSGSTVSEGDVVRVRITSSSNGSTTLGAILTVGGVLDTFDVTTINADFTPDAFSFNDVIDADQSTSYVSDTISVTGINVVTPISIAGGDAEYRILTSLPGDATGFGTASANSSSGGDGPENAFDNNTSWTRWFSGGALPAILQYDFGAGSPERITAYTLFRNNWGWDGHSPKDWTFEGSQDGSSWTILDTQINELIAVGQAKKTFPITNPVSYRYYRINISSPVSPYTNNIHITEMELLNEGSGIFTNVPGTVTNGDLVQTRITSSSAAGTSQTASLTVGTATEDFVVTTLGPDTTPDVFSFTDVEDASLSTQYESNIVTISGVNTATPITISGGGGEYKINGGSYTSSAGNINNGDVVRVRVTSSSSNSVTVSTTLNIGGESASYNVTTPAPPPDTTPDTFSFNDVNNASLNTQYESNPVIITGINTSTPISISGGEYSINEGAYTSGAGTVVSGDVIIIRNTSSASVGNTVDATLTVGTESDTYSITTIPPDTTPDSFSLGSVTDADLATFYISTPITVSDINTSASISISGGGGEYSINGGAFTSSAGTVNNGDSVRVRLESSGIGNTLVSTTLTIGGVLDSYDITTLVVDDIPDSFTFTDISNANLNTQYISNTLTITGINTETPISISGGEYSIQGGSYTSSPGTIVNNQTVSVRLLSSPLSSTQNFATLTVGGVSDNYDVMTYGYQASSEEIYNTQISNVYVTGNYNGLITHAFTGSQHYVLATPSIISYDLSSQDFTEIVNSQKLVYKGYNNLPESYKDSGLTMSGGFEYTPSDFLMFSGTKEDLGSYSGLKQIDEGIRSTYNNFSSYPDVAEYLDDYSLGYLERIIGSSIGINPIKPYYCSDILRSKLVTNIAPDALITSTPTGFNAYGTGGVANEISSTVGDLDYEFHSADPNGIVQFEWDSPQEVGYIRIYNRTGCCSDRLTGGNIKLYDQYGSLIYSHALWDTSDDFVIDVDLEGIGELHEVKKLTIESVGGNYLHFREVEIFLGGQIIDGQYKVDKDGLGGQSPYYVYCDMTTDGGGWTRIGEDYITNGDFSLQNHVGEHTFTGYNDPSDNVIVSHVTQEPPVYLPDAFVLRHDGTPTESYPLYFDEIPGEYFAQEIRLSAWVNGTSSSIFNYTLNYSDTSSTSQTAEYELIETDGDWNYLLARIPLSGLVDNFTWNLGQGISGPFYVTGLKMEVYYK